MIVMDMDRNPLRKVALSVGAAVAGLGGVLAAALQLGILTNTQAATIQTVGEQLPGGLLAAGALATLATTMVSSLLAAFGVAKVGERSVTSLADPRDNDGNKLTPDVDVSPTTPPVPDAGGPGHSVLDVGAPGRYGEA